MEPETVIWIGLALFALFTLLGYWKNLPAMRLIAGLLGIVVSVENLLVESYLLGGVLFIVGVFLLWDGIGGLNR